MGTVTARRVTRAMGTRRPTSGRINVANAAATTLTSVAQSNITAFIKTRFSSVSMFSQKRAGSSASILLRIKLVPMPVWTQLQSVLTRSSTRASLTTPFTTKPIRLSLTRLVLTLTSARKEATLAQLIKAVSMGSVHSVALVWPISTMLAARTHVQLGTHAPTAATAGTIASHQLCPTHATVTHVPTVASSSSVWSSTMPAFVPT